MSDRIKIHDLPGLLQYGTALNSYGDNVEAAAKDTERIFKDKSDGAESTAVLAFFERLNILQQQVFYSAPAIIKLYGSNVTTFSNDVTGVGFNKKAWTWGDGKDSVKTILTGKQVTTIQTRFQAIQPLLDQATEKADFPEVNLEKRHLATATENLSTMASNRESTHTSVENAHTTFNTSLSTRISELESLNTIIERAKAVTAISPTVIFTAIKDQLLTEETMFYIDNIANETDARAVEAVLGGNPEILMQLDQNAISEGTYPSLSSVMSVWYRRAANGNEEAIEIMNHYMDSFNGVDSKRVGDFVQKMMIGGMEASSMLEGKMMSLFDAGYALNSQELVEYQEQLNYFNLFNGLMKSVQYLEVGRSVETVKISENSYTKYYKDINYDKNVQIKFENGIAVLTLTTYSYQSAEAQSDAQKQKMFALIKKTPKDKLTVGFNKSTETWRSGTESATSGVHGIEYSERMKAYEEERKEAKKKFFEEMARIFADGVTTAIAPEAYLANKIVQAAVTVDVPKAANNSFKLYKKLDGSDPKDKIEKRKMGVVTGADGISSYVKWQEKLGEISEKESETKQNRFKEFTGHGAWYLEGGSEINHDFEIYRDFNASLRQRELDTHGLKGYMNSSDYHWDKQGSDAEKILDENIDRLNKYEGKDAVKISDEVRKYVKGEGDLTLEKMSATQLRELEKVARSVQNDGGSSLFNYLETNFGK